LSRYALVFAFLASLTGLVSITASHVCLGASLVLLLASKTPLRMPPVGFPLAGFMGLTVASMLASDDPMAGWPQLKKFYVFAFLVVLYSLFQSIREIRRLYEAWFVAAGVAAGLAVAQFVRKWIQLEATGGDFDVAYIDDRITGFFSHWMTFSEVILLIFVGLLSYLMFSESARSRFRVVWFGLAVVLAVSLLLTFTRSVWLALVVSLGYLIWHWNKKLLLAAPVLLVVLVLLAPGAAQRRIRSIADPGANSARLIMWKTGWQMVQAHPWLGVGPMRVGARFGEFVPEGTGELPDAYYEHLHNVFIHYAAERGIPAALMILWLLARVIWDHRKALAQLAPRRSDRCFVLRATVAATIGVTVMSCFDLTLGDSEILAVYLAIAALGYRAVQASDTPAAET
jgi:O-antigen ligase